MTGVACITVALVCSSSASNCWPSAAVSREAITTAEYPTPARRPADSRLNRSKIAIDFGIRLRPWQEAVDEIVGQLAKQGLAK